MIKLFDPFVLLLWLLGSLAFFYFAYFGFMIHEAKKPANIQKARVFPRISLIIPTFNEESVILRKLLNLEDMVYPKDKMDIIFVDSGSTDNTIQILRSFMNKNPNRFRLLVQSQRFGKASALNYAVKHAKGDIVFMTDADAILDKNAIEKIVENFNDPVIGAVTGELFILNSDQSSITKLEKSYRSFYEFIRMGESNLDSTPIFNGPITAFRKELFDDLKLDTVTDDIELCIRIREKGYRAVYEPESIAYEYAPTSMKSRMKQKSRRAQGAIQSLIRHRHLLFNSKYGKYGLVIFPCEFFMHIISPILILFLVLSLVVVTLGNSVLTVSMIVFIAVLVGGLTLFLLVSKILMPGKIITINPIDILVTFITLQASLILGFFALVLGKKSYKWEKIDDVRIVSKSKENMEMS